MEKRYYSLELSENNMLTKVFRILMGIVCISVSIFWIFFNLKLLEADNMLWLTIIFLFGFGFYQLWAAFGYTKKFIEITSDRIRMKKNSIFPVVEMSQSEISTIEIFPLNVIFYLKQEKKINLRLGTTYHETSESIIDSIVTFAEKNNIQYEIIEEKI